MNFKYLRDNRMFRAECVVESLATSPQYLLTTKGIEARGCYFECQLLHFGVFKTYL